MKHRFSIAALAFAGGRLNAQTTSPPRATITGAFVNDQTKPVDYATVTLLRAKDSTVVKGTLTNDAGRYTFDKITEGKYIVKGTSVGYQPAFTAAFDVANGQTCIRPTNKPYRRHTKTVLIHPCLGSLD